VAQLSDLSLKKQRSRVISLRDGNDRDLPTLIEGLRSPDNEVGVLSALALRGIGTARAVDVLIAGLQVADGLVVARIAHELRRLRERRAVTAREATLIERGDELDMVVAKRALAAVLGGFAERSSVAALAARLNDPDAQTRRWAARSLGWINYPESRAALAQAVDELSWWHGRWARKYIRHMNKKRQQ
jgi:HEAT repeat protein